MAKLIRPAFDAWVEIFSTTISLHKMQKKTRIRFAKMFIV